MIAAIDTSPVEAFIEALKHRDFDALQRAFAPDIRLRGLTPRTMRDETGAQAARAVVQSWFGDADLFEMETSSVEVMVDRVHAFYRIRCREDGVCYLVEQHIFAETSDGQIAALNALCSGFRPVQ